MDWMTSFKLANLSRNTMALRKLKLTAHHGSIGNGYLVISWVYKGPCLSIRGNAWECVAYRVTKIRRTTASNCVEMRGTAASNCMEMRGTAARKCVEMRGTAACVGMRVAWTPPNRGSSAREASGKRAGSAAQARGTAFPRIGGFRIYTGPAR